MNYTQNVAMLLHLAKKMDEEGSWCGETHIQKSAYVLKNLMAAPIDYRFIFYKHGPYSFDLHKALVSLQADGLLRPAIQGTYGPRWLLTSAGEAFLDSFSIKSKPILDSIEFVASRISNKTVAALERLSTALYVSLDRWGEDSEVRAKRLRQLKPHVTAELAVQSIETIDGIRSELG